MFGCRLKAVRGGLGKTFPRYWSWLTIALQCLAWILEIDGRTAEWEGNVGLFDEEEVEDNIPFSLRRLMNGRSHREYNSSDMGPGDEDDGGADDNVEEDCFNVELGSDVNDNTCVNQSGMNNVKYLSCDTIGERLITHFYILFCKNKIQWPRK